MNSLRKNLVAGLPIKNGNLEGLPKLGDRVFQCEVSSKG